MAASPSTNLDEVVITATRTREPVAQLAVPVIVITRAAIEDALAGDAADLIAALPGIEIARTGGPGQPATIFMRGTESNHTAMLIDGVRINPGTIGGAAIQNILPESIERIEIVKGARSTLYGTDAIGGVINVITRARCGARRQRLRFRRALRHQHLRRGRRRRAHAGPGRRRQHRLAELQRLRAAGGRGHAARLSQPQRQFERLLARERGAQHQRARLARQRTQRIPKVIFVTQNIG